MSEPLAAAQALFRAGKFDEAIAAYTAIVGAGGAEGASAYAGLARVYLKQKNPAAALDAANKGIALTPGKAPAIVALGEVYFRLGRLSEAEQSFLAPIRACTPDARAHLGMSRLARATSNYKRAKEEIDRAHALDPTDPEIQRLWSASLARDEHIKFLRDYLSRKTNDDDDARSGMEQLLAVLEDQSDNPHRSCRLAARVTATETKLIPLMVDAYRMRAYGLEVKLNGVSAHLLLDTGASGILIDRKIAEKAGIKPVVQTSIKGLGDKGPLGGFMGTVDSIKIGDLEFQGCYADVADRRLVAETDGLIGADVFSHFLIDLNFPDSKFKLSELPAIPDEPATETSLESHPASTVHLHDRYIAPEMRDYSPVLKFGTHLMIPTRVNDSPPKLFMIDTGAFDNTISPQAARETTHVGSDSQTTVKGLSGDVAQVYRASHVTLQFSHFRQRREDLIAFDMTKTSDAFGTEISGMLGFAMLRMLDIKIDYRDGLVDFTYDPNRFH